MTVTLLRRGVLLLLLLLGFVPYADSTRALFSVWSSRSSSPSASTGSSAAASRFIFSSATSSSSAAAFAALARGTPWRGPFRCGRGRLRSGGAGGTRSIGASLSSSGGTSSSSSSSRLAAAAQLIDGKAIAAEVRQEVARAVEALPSPPGLAVILVGGRPDSRAYVRMKKKACAAA